MNLALKQPLTDYNEVPSRSVLSKEYVRPTANSKSRQLPRHAFPVAAASAVGDAGGAEGEGSNHVVDRKSNKYTKRGLSEPLAQKELRAEQRQYTLGQIDQVLDSLNANTEGQFSNGNHKIAVGNDAGGTGDGSKGGGSAASAAHVRETMNNMRYFARPYAGVKGLMDMVDAVVDEFNK